MPPPSIKSTLITDVSEERWKDIRNKYPHFPPLMDINCVRKEAALRLPKAIENVLSGILIHDQRDSIMLSLILNICCTTVPLNIYLFMNPSHMLGLLSLSFTLFMYLQRFILMMHYVEHRKLFKEPFHSIGKYFLSGFLCAFFGIPPGMYRLHHVVMHHIENNVFNEDLSSTEGYQRDNFFHFLIYYFRYFSHMLLLPVYAIKKGRYQMAAVSFCGAASWLVLLYVGMKMNPIYTIWAGVVPMIVTGFALMFGNFSQHIFVHPSIATMPQNLKSYEFNCALSLQSINHFDNQHAFNDGYHVTHHINSRVHWTDLASHFLNNLEKYVENDVLVFDGLGFFDIGLNVMLGRLDYLADHYVHFTKVKKSKEDIIQELKVRLKPIHRTNRLVEAKDSEHNKEK
jgi:fatty acid desaturase